MPYLEKAPHVEACIAGLVDTIIRPISGVCFKAVKHALFYRPCCTAATASISCQVGESSFPIYFALHVMLELANTLSSSTPLARSHNIL